MLKKLIEELKKDDSYYLSWQANIAMAFYDEYQRAKEKNKYINNVILHKIANNAAENFLNLLIKNYSKEKKNYN